MRNIRNRYNYKERKEFQDTINDLRVYIVPLLLKRQGNVCNHCKLSMVKYEIDHLLYNPMLTINELQALCHACHVKITDYRHIKDR